MYFTPCRQTTFDIHRPIINQPLGKILKGRGPRVYYGLVHNNCTCDHAVNQRAAPVSDELSIQKKSFPSVPPSHSRYIFLSMVQCGTRSNEKRVVMLFKSAAAPRKNAGALSDFFATLRRPRLFPLEPPTRAETRT